MALQARARVSTTLPCAHCLDHPVEVGQELVCSKVLLLDTTIVRRGLFADPQRTAAKLPAGKVPGRLGGAGWEVGGHQGSRFDCRISGKRVTSKSKEAALTAGLGSPKRMLSEAAIALHSLA